MFIAVEILLTPNTKNFNLISGVSMKCYQCNSFMDTQCADHFAKADKYLLDCPANTTMCRKIVQDGMLLGASVFCQKKIKLTTNI